MRVEWRGRPIGGRELRVDRTRERGTSSGMIVVRVVL
jgi:hypothetical protein